MSANHSCHKHSFQAENQKIRNSHVVINSEGDIVSVYHKLHMFDVDIPEKNTRVMESDYVIPGERIVPPVETPVGKVGLAIVSFNCGLNVCVSPNYHSDSFFLFQVFLTHSLPKLTIVDLPKSTIVDLIIHA
jgi:hypothetical protein